MFISLIRLNTKETRDEQKVHQILSECFDEKVNDVNAIYRKEYFCNQDTGEKTVFLKVYSAVEPVGTSRALVDSRYCTEVDPSKRFKEGQVFEFKTTVYPCRKNHGSRYMIQDQTERLEWLARKFADGGAELGHGCVSEIDLSPVIVKHSYSTAKLGVKQYRGLIRISDAEKFVSLFEKGLGQGKAYGCGLLELKEVQQ